MRILTVRANRLGPQHTRDQAAVLATVHDLITGHLVFKVFGFQRHALERFEQQLALLAVSGARDSVHHRMITRVIESMAALTQLIIGAAGVWLVFQSALTVGTLAAFIGLLGVLGTGLIRFALGLPDWLSSAGALRRVDALLTEQPTVTDAPNVAPLPTIANEIRFDRVSFGYAGDQFAVRDVSFAIPAGQWVALVGRNGSGKSTLLSLMLRLWDPKGGSITIDGHDLRTVTHDSLYAQFGVVFQEVLLLNHILVLDGGRLVEHGRHDDLLAGAGVYHDLWNRQSGFIISKGGREARVTIQRLRQIPLFGTLDDAHLALLADQFTSTWASADQVIIEEGDIGDRFYLIVRGIADVVRMHEGAERRIDTLQDGDYFGEMALLSETPRTATVRARTPCLLLTLAQDEFNDLVSSAPGVRRMMDDLVRKRLINIEVSRR